MAQQQMQSKFRFSGFVNVNGSDVQVVVDMAYNHQRSTFTTTVKMTTSHIGSSDHENEENIKIVASLLQEANELAVKMSKADGVSFDTPDLFSGFEEDGSSGDAEPEPVQEGGKVRKLKAAKLQLGSE